MKKGRHRRFEEARSLKRTSDDLERLLDGPTEPCPECGADPGDDHASWCIRDDDTVDSDELFG
jgi:hypothetical protein